MQGQIRFAFSQPVQPDPPRRADNGGVQRKSASSQFPPPLDGFHPAVAAWFTATFPAPTPAQVQAWPAIRSGRHVLVSAPTGSGKTLTAFLAGIDSLVRDGLAGRLQDATRIIYVSPLKALSNDIQVNLEQPLAGIREQLAQLGLPDVDIRTAVRTGDTPQAERAALRRQPPHILVTTPESLYVLLGSESGRAMLAPASTVIVDEIHAIADDKRGAISRCRWSGWKRCAAARSRASAYRPRRSPSRKWRASWLAQPTSRRRAKPTARSSISAMRSSAIWIWCCRPRRCRW